MSLQDLTQAKPPAGDEAEEDGQQATSFFQWFDVPAPEDEPATEDEIAEIMREHIWPNPLQLYMGETVRTLADSCCQAHRPLINCVAVSTALDILQNFLRSGMSIGPLSICLACMPVKLHVLRGIWGSYFLKCHATFDLPPNHQLGYPGRVAVWPELKSQRC